MQLPGIALGVPNDARLRAIHLIAANVTTGHATAREIESCAHNAASSLEQYYDLISRCITNCRNNPANAHPLMVHMTDDQLTSGTILEQIHATEQERKQRFAQMLQEKYNNIETQTKYTSSLQCRRCNSVDVSWEQKQTRGADESMTVYCACAKCGNRWTMR